MFRLIKLAMLGLFGYAAYEFFRGMLQDTQLGARMNEAFNQGRDAMLSRGGDDAGGGMNITGPGEGAEEATLERDGGTTRHKVGRGVVS